MTALDQIRAAASQGLTRAEIEAGIIRRKMTDDEATAFNAARGIWKLREAKRKAEKKDAIRDQRENMRARRDAAAAIDAQIIEARTKIDWKRRRRAEKSLEAWIKTYGIGVFINDEPPKPHGSEILREMEEANRSGRPYQILVGRGGGKTSYAEANDLKRIATGQSKLLVISCANAKAAQQIKREIDAAVTSEPFATDYPDTAIPFKLLDGHGRRAQTYGGRSTQCRMTTDRTQFPVIIEPDGKAALSSGACIVAKALKSVRGTKNGTQRPDTVHLDDLQTREIAQNPERVQETMRMLRGDVMGLAGKGKMSITLTATTIAEDDVTQQIKADPAWKTTEFKSIIKWPNEWEKDGHGLWGEYFDKFDEDNASDLPHDREDGSLAFYKANREAMDAGADILNWNYYDADKGQVSGLQRLMDAYHHMGHADFMAEHQMEPQRESFAVPISARMVMSRTRKGVERLTVPPDTVLTVATTDINPSYGLTTQVTTFDVNMTSFCTAYWVTKLHIPDELNDVEFTRRVEIALAAEGRKIAALGLQINKWGIDAGGRQFVAVTHFAPNAQGACGLDALPMLGRAGQNWNPNVKSRIRTALNDTVLCRDVQGRKFLAWNADAYKEKFHLACGTETGATGGFSLYDDPHGHAKFATQIANERLIEKVKMKNDSGSGTERYVYRWRTKDPHDFLDTSAMAYALAGANSIDGSGRPRNRKHKREVYNG